MEEVLEELLNHIDEVAGDPDAFSQEESIEMYRRIASHCQNWVQAIQADLERG